MGEFGTGLWSLVQISLLPLRKESSWISLLHYFFFWLLQLLDMLISAGQDGLSSPKLCRNISPMTKCHLNTFLLSLQSLTHLRQDSSHISFRHQELEEVNPNFSKRHFLQFSKQYSVSGTASEGFWSFKCTKSLCLSPQHCALCSEPLLHGWCF